jgi:hypothetical protein
LVFAKHDEDSSKRQKTLLFEGLLFYAAVTSTVGKRTSSDLSSSQCFRPHSAELAGGCGGAPPSPKYEKKGGNTLLSGRRRKFVIFANEFSLRKDT